MAHKKFSNEQLIEILRDYIKDKGIPKSKDFTAKNGLPANELYRRRFGSWYDALLLTGVEISQDRQKYYQNDRLTDEKLLADLRIITQIHLKDNPYLLDSSDFKKYDDIQSYSVYARRFGGIKESYKLIGYDYNEFNNKQLEQDMLNKLLQVKEVLGRNPNTNDLNYFSQNCNGYYSASAYDHHFGNISNSLSLVGIRPTQSSITKRMSEDELIQSLKDYYAKHNKIPSQPDTWSELDMPVYVTFVKKFGSWNNALKKAFGDKFKIKRVAKKMVTERGRICRSMLEYLFASMLEEHDFDYKIDNIYYRDYILDYNGGYRFDFLLNIDGKDIFIEIFGFIGNEYKSQIKYENDKNYKIQLCKDNNLLLLDFYPHDIYRKSTDQIYRIFINKYNNMMQRIGDTPTYGRAI